MDKEQRASQAMRSTVREKRPSDLGQERGYLILDDPMQATADHLIRIATKAFMQMRNVDYETAQRWIARAAVPEAKNGKPVPKSRKARS